MEEFKTLPSYKNRRVRFNHSKIKRVLLVDNNIPNIDLVKETLDTREHLRQNKYASWPSNNTFTPKYPRNKPYSCGSGLKSKKCCNK